MGRILIGQALGLNDIENAIKNGEIEIGGTYVRVADFDKLLLESEYPVGGKPYIQYFGMQTPAERWAGTSWEIDTRYQGRMIIGSGGDYAFGTMGGEATHTLTVAEMPQHTHFTVGDDTQNTTDDTRGISKWSVGVGELAYELTASSNVPYRARTSPTGTGSAHNNIPPYIVVNFWKRTA